MFENDENYDDDCGFSDGDQEIEGKSEEEFEWTIQKKNFDCASLPGIKQVLDNQLDHLLALSEPDPTFWM